VINRMTLWAFFRLILLKDWRDSNIKAPIHHILATVTNKGMLILDRACFLAVQANQELLANSQS